MIEPGLYLNDGVNDLLVAAVKYYKEKQYAYLIDEKDEIGFFVEIIRENEGFRFERVTSPELSELLIIEFSEIKDILEKVRNNNNLSNNYSEEETNNS